MLVELSSRMSTATYTVSGAEQLNRFTFDPSNPIFLLPIETRGLKYNFKRSVLFQVIKRLENNLLTGEILVSRLKDGVRAQTRDRGCADPDTITQSEGTE